MKKNGILNPSLIAQLAALGHTDLIVIADAGLPVPTGVPVIDLSLVRGIPSFADTLSAVCQELVVESYILASETATHNQTANQLVEKNLPSLPSRLVSHQEFKTISAKAKAIIRTGECTPYANIILVCGTNF